MCDADDVKVKLVISLSFGEQVTHIEIHSNNFLRDAQNITVATKTWTMSRMCYIFQSYVLSDTKKHMITALQEATLHNSWSI
jgi:hypothetical protein